MPEVSIRELRNHGGEVIDRVERGERLTVTRDGRPVAQLAPLRGAPLSAAALLARWSRLPHVDPAALFTDIDGLIDQGL
jgi:prevent-host-death family protein